MAVIGLVGYFYFARSKFLNDFLPRYQKADVGGLADGELKNEAVGAEAVKVPIFVYHCVALHYPHESKNKKRYDEEPDVFEKQMLYLKNNGYSVISFDNLINYFSGKLPLPKKSVILTFDDGWENQYKYAFPILKKYNYTAIFFIFTNAIGHKYYLTWQEIKELDASGEIIGDHSKSHPYLFKITDKGELYKEIVESRKILESGLHKKVDIFAYPFGFYNDEIIKTLKENEFRAARTDGYYGVFHTQDDLFTLKSVEAENDMAKFIAALNINKK